MSGIDKEVMDRNFATAKEFMEKTRSLLVTLTGRVETIAKQFTEFRTTVNELRQTVGKLRGEVHQLRAEVAELRKGPDDDGSLD